MSRVTTASSARRAGRTRRSLAALGVLVVVGALVLAGTPAAALPPDQVGVFPTWSTAGASGAFTATGTFPASASFPPVAVTTDTTSFSGPTGVSGFLGASTAFGQNFGSTRSQPYLTVGTAAGQSNSTTTLTFTGPQPDGWGFALGDVDADWVLVRAWADAARTAPLDVSQLGFQSVGNYCTNVPRPGSCGAGPYTDQPVWVTAAETFDEIAYLPGTLRGNSLPGTPAPGLDTAGAYGWFTPTTDIAVLDLVYGRRDGFPLFQLWLASPAPKVTLTGTVAVPGVPAGSPIPPETVIQLNNSDGSPVLNAEEAPVQTPVSADGAFTIDTEQRPADDPYQLAVIPPPGFVAPAPITVVADSPTPAPVAFDIAPEGGVPPAPEQPPAGQPAPADPLALAATGMDPALAAWGLLMVLLGTVMVLRRRFSVAVARYRER